MTLQKAALTDCVIDGQNRRIGKKVNGALVEGFVYRSQLQPAAWLDGTGAVKATFVYGDSPNVPEYMAQGTTTYRLITDQVGSVRLVQNASTGAATERIDFDEFGNVLSDTAPGTQPFGFAGGLRDLDTGLTRFGVRDYDPVTGRWTAKDPLRFENGDTDLYVYAAADPVNRIDPTGAALIILPPGPPPPWTWPIIGGVAGGVIGGLGGAGAGTLALPGGGTVGGGLGGASTGAGIGAAIGAAAAAGAMAADWQPPPFTPGWQPPSPAKTQCTVEQQPPPPMGKKPPKPPGGSKGACIALCRAKFQGLRVAACVAACVVVVW